jgi:hypothetical protein
VWIDTFVKKRELDKKINYSTRREEIKL